MSLVDICCILVVVYRLCKSEHLSLIVDEMNIPPRRRRDQPRRASVDEEATTAPHSHAPQKSPMSNPNLKFHRCHLWQLLLNLELNILDSVYHHRALLVEVTR